MPTSEIDKCPNCGEIWCLFEIQDQECFNCGYPNHEAKKEEEYDHEFDDDQYD
jgi:ribosomal protein L37E